MAKRTIDELLFVATGTMANGNKRHFSVYKHGGAVLVTSSLHGQSSSHLCAAGVKTEDQIKTVIRLVFRVTDVTVLRPR
jgi:hypothetical protein